MHFCLLIDYFGPEIEHLKAFRAGYRSAINNWAFAFAETAARTGSQSATAHGTNFDDFTLQIPSLLGRFNVHLASVLSWVQVQRMWHRD